MRVGPATNVARINVTETITALWTFAHANGISLDDIIERTADAGVTIDGVTLKDRALLLLGFALATDNALAANVVGDVDSRIVIDAGGEISWGPGSAGRDTNLYRALLNVLKTDDSLEVAGVLGVIADLVTERTADAGVTIDGVLLKDVGILLNGIAAVTDNALRTLITGDVEGRFIILGDGKQEWGPGNVVRDTNLYRFAAGVLKTDDDLHVGGALTPLSDIVTAERTIALAIGANNNVATGTVPVQRLSVAGGAADISGFVDGVAGRLLVVYNVVTLDITLQHQNGGSVAANRIMCPGNVNLLLDPSDSAMLRYDDTLSRWFVISTGV